MSISSKKNIISFTAVLAVANIVFVTILTGYKAGVLSMTIAGLLLIVLHKLKGKLSVNHIVIKIYFLLTMMSTLSVGYAMDVTFWADVIWKMYGLLFNLIFLLNFIDSISKVFELIRYFLFFSLCLALYNITNHDPFIREMAYGGVNVIALLMFTSILFSVFVYIKQRSVIVFLLFPIYFYTLLLTASQKTLLALGIILVLYIGLLFLKLRIRKFFKIVVIGSLIGFGVYYLLSSVENLALSSVRTFATIEEIFSGEKVQGSAGGASSDGIRERLKENGFIYFSESPFLGYGLNNYRALDRLKTGMYTYSHYTPIELVVGMGFLAFFLYYSIYVYSIRYILKVYKKTQDSIYLFFVSSIIAYIIIGFYMQTYFDHVLHLFLILILIYSKFNSAKVLAPIDMNLNNEK